MYTAFCHRPDCDWEAEGLFGDSLAAFEAVSRHLVDEHGAHIAGLAPTQFRGMSRVLTMGDVHSRAYIAEAESLAAAVA